MTGYYDDPSGTWLAQAEENARTAARQAGFRPIARYRTIVFFFDAMSLLVIGELTYFAFAGLHVVLPDRSFWPGLIFGLTLLSGLTLCAVLYIRHRHLCIRVTWAWYVVNVSTVILAAVGLHTIWGLTLWVAIPGSIAAWAAPEMSRRYVTEPARLELISILDFARQCDQCP